MQKVWFFIALILSAVSGYGQCTNTVYYPPSEVVASSYDDTVVISSYSYAGDYAIVREMSPGETYQFASSAPGDYLTIREADDTSILLAHGPSPLMFDADLIDRVSVHINLSSPTCGTEKVDRETTALCTTCDGAPAKVGIHTSAPEASLEVNGEVLIGDSGRTPKAGMIRWNASTEDFEGYNGESWMSFTSANSNTWGSVSSATINENEKLIPTGNDVGLSFGTSIDFDGDYAVIGAPQFDEFLQPEGIGDAYIFRKENGAWVQIQKVSASDGVPNDNFGRSVAIGGDYMAIGANYADVSGNSSQGAVYIFKRTLDTWSEVDKLVASDGAANDWFGSSLSIEGSTLCVGAPQSSTQAYGAVYVFDRSGSTWSESTKITVGVSSLAYFGSSLDLENNTLVIGAPSANVSTTNDQGKVFIYAYNGSTWTLQEELTADDGQALDNFGSSVAINNNNLVIGAEFKDIGSTTNQGGAYLYTKSGSVWELAESFHAADGESYHNFGNSIEIVGDEIVVGAYQYVENGNLLQGAAYLFEKTSSTNVTQRAKILPTDTDNYQLFGNTLYIDEGMIAIGASRASGTGAVYLLYRN